MNQTSKKTKKNKKQIPLINIKQLLDETGVDCYSSSVDKISVCEQLLRLLLRDCLTLKMIDGQLHDDLLDILDKFFLKSICEEFQKC